MKTISIKRARFLLATVKIRKILSIFKPVKTDKFIGY